MEADKKDREKSRDQKEVGIGKSGAKRNMGWREGRRPPWYPVWQFWFGLFRWIFKKLLG